MKDEIIAAYQKGKSINGLSREYDISRYAIQSWCELRKVVELRQAAPLPKGRLKVEPQTQEQIIKRQRMENENVHFLYLHLPDWS